MQYIILIPLVLWALADIVLCVQAVKRGTLSWEKSVPEYWKRKKKLRLDDQF